MVPFRAIIVSHKEDMDGFISALLVKHWLLAHHFSESQIAIYLVNYNELPQTLDQILPSISTSWFCMTDLGLNTSSIQRLSQFPLFSPSDPTRIYIDHHHIAIPRHLMDERFALYLNPEVLAPEEKASYLREGLQMTAAVLTKLVFFSNRFENILSSHSPRYPSHFDALVQYAFEMDHLENLSHAPDPLAVKLKKYISFFQNDGNALLQLLDTFLDLTRYNQFIQKIDIELAKIDTWYDLQQKQISANFITKQDHGIKFIAATSELRAGEITQHLLNIHPEFDIYFGVSTKEKYMNIRTTSNKFMFLNHFAEPLLGGGHENRAGFPIPHQFLALFSPSSPPKSFPEELLAFLIHHFHQIHFTSVQKKVN